MAFTKSLADCNTVVIVNTRLHLKGHCCGPALQSSIHFRTTLLAQPVGRFAAFMSCSIDEEDFIMIDARVHRKVCIVLYAPGALGSLLMAGSADMQGPAFEVDARKTQGRIFTWIDRMFTSKILTSTSLATAGPSKAVVARLALMNLLSSNPDVMEGCIDQCYVPNGAIARGFFEVSSISRGFIATRNASPEFVARRKLTQEQA